MKRDRLPNQPRRLSRDMAGVLGARATWALLGMFSGIILARWLGPHDRGILAMALLVPATAMTLAKLGISQANVFLINRRREAREEIASNATVLAIIFGTAAAALVWLCRAPLLDKVLHGMPTWALLIALVRVPFLLVDDYLHGVLQAVGLFRVYNSRLIYGEALRLVLVVVALVLLGWGLAAAVWIYTLVTIVNVGWLVVTTRRAIPFTLRVNRRLLSEQLQFGAKSYVQTLAQHLLLRIDLFMVSSFLGAAQLAFYSLALRLTELVLEIPQAVGLVLYPRLASLADKEMHQLTAQACRRTLVITGLAAIGLAVLGPYIIILWYGWPYGPAGDPLPWAAAGVLMMSLFFILTRNFTSRNLQQVNFAVGALALVANVALNLVLIPAYGIVGAAIATAISYSAACLLLLVLFITGAGISVSDVLIVNGEDVRFFRQVARRAALRGRRLVGLGPISAGH
jgi:O-antigen/teichoic acid export membrane protein